MTGVIYILQADTMIQYDTHEIYFKRECIHPEIWESALKMSPH